MVEINNNQIQNSICYNSHEELIKCILDDIFNLYNRTRQINFETYSNLDLSNIQLCQTTHSELVLQKINLVLNNLNNYLKKERIIENYREKYKNEINGLYQYQVLIPTINENFNKNEINYIILRTNNSFDYNNYRLLFDDEEKKLSLYFISQLIDRLKRLNKKG